MNAALVMPYGDSPPPDSLPARHESELWEARASPHCADCGRRTSHCGYPAKTPAWDLGRSPWYVRYGAAVVFILLALALQFLPAARQVPFAFFFAAVALSAHICGFGAAIFSTISAAVADFFLLPPRFSFAVRGDDVLRLLFFALVALVISSLAKKRSEADKIADERRAQLAAVVESSEDAILNKTLDGTVLTWNRAAQAMYGYTPEEMIGRNVAALAPPEKAGEIAGILQRLRRGERIAHFETKHAPPKMAGALIYLSPSLRYSTAKERSERQPPLPATSRTRKGRSRASSR